MSAFTKLWNETRGPIQTFVGTLISDAIWGSWEGLVRWWMMIPAIAVAVVVAWLMHVVALRCGRYTMDCCIKLAAIAAAVGAFLVTTALSYFFLCLAFPSQCPAGAAALFQFISGQHAAPAQNQVVFGRD